MTTIINQKFLNYILPFIFGVITSFSLPPYNFTLINFITFSAFLFILILNRKQSKWTSFKIGWSFGFGYFISNLYWITNSLTFDEIFKPLIPFAFILVPLFLGIFYGLVAFISSFFNLKKNFSSILVFSFIFSLIEFLRSFILGGFPWNIIVYTWSSYLSSIQILSLIGTYSLNLLSITFFVSPLIFFFKIKSKYKIISLIFFLVIFISNIFYGTFIIKNKKFINDNINYKIKILSPKIAINRFLNYENPENIVNELIALSKPDFSENTIFVFPEGILSSIYFEDLKNYQTLFSNNFSDNHIIIMGMNTYKKVNDKLNVYNSLVVFDNKLNLLSKYDKIKLVPFGEFLPFEDLFLKLGLKKVTFGYQSFSAGKKRDLIKIKNSNLYFIPLICYEIIYSGKLTNQNAEFIINISEDGWFGDSIGPHQHFVHSKFRAIEEGKNVIRSANNGISAYINPNGETIKKLESTKKGVIEINEFIKSKKTFFSRYGQKIFFYFLLFYISLIFFFKRLERSSNEKRLFIY